MTEGDSLRPDDLQRGLTTTVLGRVFYFHPEVESTNAVARSLAAQGGRDGSVVAADFQTAGRGRLDRTWSAPPGSSLLFSLLLRPSIGVERIAQVTMAAGLGCVAGIARAGGINARLKWPNDITLDGRKAGGMLGEFSLRADALEYVIIGIGINVNFDPAEVEGIPPGATSLMLHSGRRLPRAPLLRAILEEMEPRYQAVCAGGSLREEWARALETIGADVRATTHTGAVEGLAEDVDETGALILRLADGSRQSVHAGDVVALRLA